MKTYNKALVGTAFLLAAALAIWLVLVLLPGSPLSPLAAPVPPGRAALAAMFAALIAAVAEAMSPHGTDNLSVPFAAALVVFLVAG